MVSIADYDEEVNKISMSAEIVNFENAIKPLSDSNFPDQGLLDLKNHLFNDVYKELGVTLLQKM